MKTVTRVVANFTTHETCTYEFEGVVDASQAYELISTGEHEPVDSDIHSEDIHVVHLTVAPHAIVGDDGTVRCSECNSAEFTYRESHPSERRQARNGHGALAFYGDFEWFDGDDDPGVVCDNGHTVDTSEIKVDWA